MQTIRICLLINLAVATSTVSAQDKPSSEAGTWIRQLSQISGDFRQVLLVVQPEKIGELTFNGQRLMRHSRVEPLVRFDVTQLARRGRNCVAIGSAEKQLTDVSVGLFVDGRRISNQNCKTTVVSPPVGWRQSDFNDRDWKKATFTVVEEWSNASELKWKTTRKRQPGSPLFQADDHVVLLGATFIERAQRFGHLETELSLATEHTDLTFRNLGWSGDTVFAESRGIFDSPERGYERMVEHVRSEEPSVILICYGQNEAMQFSADTDGDRFLNQLGRLCDDLAPTGAEIVLISPHPVFGPASRWNERISEYVAAIKGFARESDLRFVDLNTDFLRDMTVQLQKSIGASDSEVVSAMDPDLMGMLSDNGMHWNELGYRFASQVLADRLVGSDTQTAIVRVSRDEAVSDDVQISDFQTNDEAITFEVSATMSHREIKIAAGGELFGAEISMNGKSVAAGQTVPWVNTADSSKLRQLIVRKNELYFHRWRPQNITYLFGFRKHEQGNNAAEIAMFDPRIAEIEDQIRALRQNYKVSVKIER